MRSIRTVRAAHAATFESVGSLLSSHRGVTRVSLAAISFTFIIAFSTQAPVTQAGPEPTPLMRASILPQNVGVGVATGTPITITFDAAMDPGSVEAALEVVPEQPVELTWSDGLDQLTVAPGRLWRTDTSYVVIVGNGAMQSDGRQQGGERRFAFTTETAPTVSDFQVALAHDAGEPVPDAKIAALLETDPGDPGSHEPTTTARDVSASSSVTVSFSTAMDAADVEERFAISPEIPGALSWRGSDLVFAPAERLVPGTRYTISVVGAHDRTGNPIGGNENFSFLVQAGAQLTMTAPKGGARDAEPEIVELWFSQPMGVNATNKAFSLTDGATGALVGGNLSWNEAGTQLTYVPDRPFAGGRTFNVAFDGGARDADGNVVTAALGFTTKAAPVQQAPATPTVRSGTAAAPAPPGPATSLAGYALNQVNAARAANGFAPVVLDASVSAVASAHAWDQARNGYFSHTGRNGSTRESRLAAGGVGFGWSGENQCYHVGIGEQATLDWCHAQFMAEPYPGHWNHIANILNPNARRMGVGIATVGGRTVITWNFAD